MKTNNMMKGLSVLMSCSMLACASYNPSMVRVDSEGPNLIMASNGGVTINIEEFATPEKSQKAFDTDLAKTGVLPLLIHVENNSDGPFDVKNKDIVVREGNRPLKSLSPEEAASKAKRSAVGRAIGWSLIVPIISIPIAVVASSMHTSKVNKAIIADFAAKAFPDVIIPSKRDKSGFLYIELPDGRENLSGLTLEVKTTNILTKESVIITSPLPAAKFKVDKPEDVEEEYEGNNWASGEKNTEPIASVSQPEPLPSSAPETVETKDQPSTIESQLQKLIELRQKNLITKEEYQSTKQQLLKKLTQ